MGKGFIFWSDENVLELDVSQYCEWTKSHWIVYFKMVNFMLSEFYLDEGILPIVIKKNYVHHI